MRQPFLFYTPCRMNTIYSRTLSSTKQALPKARKTIWWLLKLILPISLAVSLLQYWGIIAYMAQYLSPAFSVIGLPGETAIAFISSLFLPLYAPIAVMATLSLDMREITILALMCLISHNMFVESAIQRKTGSSAVVMFILRIITSFIAAYILNLLLPSQIGRMHNATEAVTFSNITDMLLFWAKGAGWLILKITVIVTGLMVLQNILKEFKIMDMISALFAPVMKVMGLSPSSSFLWFVSQIVGLTYGSAIMIDAVNKEEISAKDANLLNYHIAINHSLLEDTLLFVAIGVPAFWIVVPRVLLAMIAVWSVRLFARKTSPALGQM